MERIFKKIMVVLTIMLAVVIVIGMWYLAINMITKLDNQPLFAIIAVFGCICMTIAAKKALFEMIECIDKDELL